MLTTTSWHSWGICLAAKTENEDLIRVVPVLIWSLGPAWLLSAQSLTLAWHSPGSLSLGSWQAPSDRLSEVGSLTSLEAITLAAFWQNSVGNVENPNPSE